MIGSVIDVVQASQAQHIQEAWERAGSPLCEHNDSASEYMLSMHTGDRVCLTCGVVWWPGNGTPPPSGS